VLAASAGAKLVNRLTRWMVAGSLTQKAKGELARVSRFDAGAMRGYD
jgi:hypothetical protein